MLDKSGTHLFNGEYESSFSTSSTLKKGGLQSLHRISIFGLFHIRLTRYHKLWNHVKNDEGMRVKPSLFSSVPLDSTLLPKEVVPDT